MAFVTPTAAQLALYLRLDEIDGPRAEFLIQQAISLCMTVVKPLPDEASVTVLAAAGRAFTNPTNATYETIGPASAQHPQWAGGLYLSKADKSALKSAAGRGGAFTVDPTPADADPSPTWPMDDTFGPGLEFEPGWGWV